jgi:phospholipase C
MTRLWLPGALLLLCACPSPTPAADAGYPTPIRYVVVIVKENHTFDNYFTGFPGTDDATTAPLSDGGTLVRPKAPLGDTPRDISHSRDNALVGFNDGKMDSFDLMYEARPKDGGPPDYLPFVYYPEEQIPNYWAYAKNFVLFDRFFSTVFGPSTPGHIATVAAQSPTYSNSFCFGTQCTGGGSGCVAPASTLTSVYDPNKCVFVEDAYPCFDIPTVPDVLRPEQTWLAYSPGKDGSGAPMVYSKTSGQNAELRAAHFRHIDKVLTDLDTIELPNYLHLKVSGGTPSAISEHPTAHPCVGENHTVDIVNRLMQSPHWNEMAIVITWDDWGGFYDHVPPPVERCANGQFYGPGFRVPAIILSPYAKQGVVLHDVTEQASIPKLMEELWGLKSLKSLHRNARDEKVGSMMNAFDFNQAPRPPMLLQKRTCQ